VAVESRGSLNDASVSRLSDPGRKTDENRHSISVHRLIVGAISNPAVVNYSLPVVDHVLMFIKLWDHVCFWNR